MRPELCTCARQRKVRKLKTINRTQTKIKNFRSSLFIAFLFVHFSIRDRKIRKKKNEKRKYRKKKMKLSQM